MSLAEHLRVLVDALPSDTASVTLCRADLVRMLDAEAVEETRYSTRDLTVNEVADEVQRSPSTVRAWLANGHLLGYKLNGRDWRVARQALRAFLDQQQADSQQPRQPEAVDIAAWRRIRGGS